ncbi:transglutaminaseTgpA domain-containing protein [Pannus brasiliensis CCIBt3594]|uniref:TransglutaminaseTgpA domain-containing protein n=1 Tax=Pannus brasiliensis CCIBt3594 TaxID=1427578 RepID=A0AAW9QU22_9CHRO
MISNRLHQSSFWQKLSKPRGSDSSLETEESPLFRILVQTLVIVGIIATDIATESTTSFWAVPLSIIGGIWSWYRRKKRNVGAKFVIAIGMLVVLAVFLGNIVSMQDSRVSLARLLIQLQVLHSFDLPRRKDLGYSMMIGLILIGVAGTISQTIAFAPWLILFLLLAIPTLVLDYRSRLGLERIDNRLNLSFSRKNNANRSRSVSPLSGSLLAPKKLGIFFLAILLFGLAIFALLPRFPGYQIQSFPVSGPEGMENQDFQRGERQIVNPGYVREGQGTGTNPGQSPTSGAGKMDSTFYYGFNSKINQNLRGQMTPKVVLRVRSQAPGFWRVLAFDRYTGQGWEVSREQQAQDLDRSRWSFRFFVPLPSTRAKTRQIVQSYTAVSQLPNLIPALASPQFLFFPTRQVSIDAENSLRSPAGLTDGLTYTVISQVPERDRTALGAAPKQSPRSIQKYYRQVPEAIEAKVRQKTEEMLAKSPKPLTSDYEKVLFLAQALKQNYQLKTDLPFLKDGEDLVEAFLFRFEGGYGDHFATALTIMARSIGIPARLTVGFAPGQFNPFTGFYVVKNTDAHALTEVYFPEYGWFAFDPIPGHDLIPPSFEEAETFGVLKQFWHWVAGWLPSPVTGFLGWVWETAIGAIGTVVGWLWRFMTESLIGGIIAAIFGVGLGFLGWLAWKPLSRWVRGRQLAKYPPIERLYRQLLDTLREKGQGKHPAQTPLEYAAAIRSIYPEPVAAIVEEISRAYVDWRYGDRSADVNYLRGRFAQLSKSVRK